MISHEAMLFVEEAAIAEEHLAAARHDLRNRLAVVRGSAFYLRRRMEGTDLWGADPRIAQFFQQMESEVETASSLVGDRMTVVRPLTQVVRPTDTAECAHDAVRAARVAAGTRVRVDLDVEPALVDLDATELCVALRCLIENAVEAMEDGGVATVAVRRTDGEVVIEVTDTGPGFGAGMSDRGLEPFFTTKTGHRGLGLNIAQRIGKRYGGAFEILPRPAGGACVSLRFAPSGGQHDDSPGGR